INTHIFLENFPGTISAPIKLTIPTLSASYLNMLVSLDSIHFTEAGQVFSSATTSTNRNMVDQYGNILTLRTSNYATFQPDLIPSGTGTVTGVLSIFNGGYQFFIRDLNDLKGFNN
ncbi:MAG: hypothetical protein HGB12_16795, partial [Bacteroidetes bacterium]|nr:hypothetical protein [Bacteroidota bacterium]